VLIAISGHTGVTMPDRPFREYYGKYFRDRLTDAHRQHNYHRH